MLKAPLNFLRSAPPKPGLAQGGTIEVRNLYKSFGDKDVLKDISFEFEPAKINMIIGASGSGKTVLLKCLVGLMEPTQGEILYDGDNFLAMRHKELRALRSQMGMLFQYSALFDSMSVAENVAFPLQMHTKMNKRQQRDRVEWCLEKVNLPNAIDLYPSEISGGMKKRVGIARAIALEPKYLFCDEPNSGLDPTTAEVIDQLIRKVTDDLKVTTVVVSHDMKSVMSISDKLMFIHEGRNEWSGRPDEVGASDNDKLRNFIEISGITTDASKYKH